MTKRVVLRFATLAEELLIHDNPLSYVQYQY